MRGGTADRPHSGQTVQPSTAVTATLSRRPRPGRLTPAPRPPSRRHRIIPGSSGKVTLRTSDDGATVILERGQVVIVVLAGHGMTRWNPLRLAGAAPAALRQLSLSGGYPSAAPARASYRATQRGTAEIISGTNAKCLHATPPCAIAQLLWQVTVVVR
jgi:hypothetical protein